MRHKLIPVLTLCLALGAASQTRANQIVLEGSDATAFHMDATYTLQLFTFMQGGSALPVLILGTVPLSASVAGISTLAGSYSLAGFDLANYSAVYVESPGGCCEQNPSLISAGDQALIGAAEATGLNLTIENYGGGPAWGPMLPAAVNALPAGDFGGITDYGTAGGPGCTDGEVFNAEGLAHGFTQPPVLGCYEHQAYLTSAFTALGFLSLVDADPAFFGGPLGIGSALLALGGELGAPAAVPEPASLTLIGTGLVGLASRYRRKKRA